MMIVTKKKYDTDISIKDIEINLLKAGLEKLHDKLDQQNAFIRNILISSYLEAPPMFAKLRENFEIQVEKVWIDTDTQIIYTNLLFADAFALYQTISGLFKQPELVNHGTPIKLIDRWHFVVKNSWTILMEGGAINSGQTIVVPTKGWEGGVQ